MTRILLSILFGLILSFPANAQKKNKDFEKMIRKYDITSILETKEGKPEDFWRQLSKNHEGLTAYAKLWLEDRKLP